MERTLPFAWQKVAEVELTYKSKIKPSERPRITQSKDAADLLTNLWNKEKIELVEEFKILLLNRTNRILGMVEISSGGVTGTEADPKLVLVSAIKANACGIIITRNHPSGNTKPSRTAEELTQKIKLAAQYIDIKLLDHIIITNEGYLSFANKGLL